MDIAGTGLNEILARVREPLDRPARSRASNICRRKRAYFRELVQGVIGRSAQARSADRRGAAAGWPLKRIEAMLRAVMRAGAYELEPRATFPRASWCPNMSTSPTRSSIATRPAWSTRCWTRSRGRLRRREEFEHGAAARRMMARQSRQHDRKPRGEDRLIARYFAPLATAPRRFRSGRRCGRSSAAAGLRSRAQDRRRSSPACISFLTIRRARSRRRRCG